MLRMLISPARRALLGARSRPALFPTTAPPTLPDADQRPPTLVGRSLVARTEGTPTAVATGAVPCEILKPKTGC